MSRTPLTRDRILETAIALADEGGLEAVSMRKVGQALGVEAMSLYNHVANKSELVKGMVDGVAAEFEPRADADWTSALRQAAISAHQALKRHPWACEPMMSAAAVGPARVRYMDSLLRTIREAGFPAELVYHAYHILDAHIFGFSLWLAGHQLPVDREQLPALVEQFRGELPLDDYPDVIQHIDQHMSHGPHQDVSAFELGLNLILDGLEQMRTRPAIAPD